MAKIAKQHAKTALRGLLPLPDPLILTLWIAGIVLAMGLLWSLTGNFRSSILMRRVNRVLIEKNAPWRVSAPLEKARNSINGTWFTVFREGATSSAETCFVFSIFDSGVSVTCAALCAEGRGITELIPLGVHGEAVFGRLPPLLIESYTRRIEANRE